MSEVIKIIDVSEIDVLVECPCGTQFIMYIPNVPYKCTCGKLYSSSVVIMEQEYAVGGFTLQAQPIAEYIFAGDKDAKDEA